MKKEIFICKKIEYVGCLKHTHLNNRGVILFLSLPPGEYKNKDDLIAGLTRKFNTDSSCFTLQVEEKDQLFLNENELDYILKKMKEVPPEIPAPNWEWEYRHYFSLEEIEIEEYRHYLP